MQNTQIFYIYLLRDIKLLPYFYRGELRIKILCENQTYKTFNV